MTGSVIERLGHKVVAQDIIFNERAVTWEEADKRAGFRLDRRKRWAFIKSDVAGVPDLCDCIEWSVECSECCTGTECWHPSTHVRGCSHCGYTGRAQRSSWVPYFREEKDT